MSKPRFFKLAFLVIVLVATPVIATVHYPNNHPVLFNLISNGYVGGSEGNNIVDNGDDVALGVGTFSGAPYGSSATVYHTNGIYFTLVCSGAPHICVLDGLNSRRLMYIDGTGGGTMTLAGIFFLDGYVSGHGHGGALFITSSAE